MLHELQKSGVWDQLPWDLVAPTTIRPPAPANHVPNNWYTGVAGGHQWSAPIVVNLPFGR
ncbi:MAG: hypothetical protein GY926_08170 [bacterium]|nr:hypothetical protein [bacterium]